MEVMKIPQQKENLFKSLEEGSPRGNQIEVVVMTEKPQIFTKPMHSRGKVPPFFISL